MRHRELLSGKWNPRFVPCGLALQNIQLEMWNVVGEGASTKKHAVVNWFKMYRKLLGDK